MTIGTKSLEYLKFEAYGRPSASGAPQCRRALTVARPEKLGFTSIMQACPDPAGFMAITLSKDGLIGFLSANAERLTGYTAQDLVGRPITCIMADRSVFELPRMLDSARQCGFWGGEIVHRCRSGKSFQARATLMPLTGQDQTVWSYLLVSTLNAPPELNRSDLPIREMASKLRTISHEMNNPLAVMMGFAQLILLNMRCEGQMRTDMEKLYSELKRVIQVVEKLHCYAIDLQEEHPAKNALK